LPKFLQYGGEKCVSILDPALSGRIAGLFA
jgi:hypothetical protein